MRPYEAIIVIIIIIVTIRIVIVIVVIIIVIIVIVIVTIRVWHPGAVFVFWGGGGLHANPSLQHFCESRGEL